MIDPHLSVILSVMTTPQRCIKFHLDATKISRGTFFKVKSDLEALGIVSKSETKHLKVDAEKALIFILNTYPGLPAAYEELFKKNGQDRSSEAGATDHAHRIS